jgi:hypothetical protein
MPDGALLCSCSSEPLQFLVAAEKCLHSDRMTTVTKWPGGRQVSGRLIRQKFFRLPAVKLLFINLHPEGSHAPLLNAP